MAKVGKLPLLATEDCTASLQFVASANEISIAATTAAAMFFFFFSFFHVRNAWYFFAQEEKIMAPKLFISEGRGCYSMY